jgi:hypothetical protein
MAKATKKNVKKRVVKVESEVMLLYKLLLIILLSLLPTRLVKLSLGVQPVNQALRVLKRILPMQLKLLQPMQLK